VVVSGYVVSGCFVLFLASMASTGVYDIRGGHGGVALSRWCMSRKDLNISGTGESV